MSLYRLKRGQQQLLSKQADTRFGDKVVLTNVFSPSLLQHKQGHCHGFGWAEEKQKEQTQYLSVLALTADDIILIRDTRPPVRVRGS